MNHRALPLLLLLVACGSDGAGTVTASPATATPTTEATPTMGPSSAITTIGGTSTTTTTTTTTTTSTPVAVLSVASQLRIDGLGPVSIGMTLERARAAAGLPLDLQTTPYCRSLLAHGALEGVTLIATNSGGGTIDVIVVNGPPITTVSGIRIGSSQAEVLSTYGDQVTVVTDRRIVYRARDASLRGRVLVFAMERGAVRVMYAGDESLVLADEICA